MHFIFTDKAPIVSPPFLNKACVHCHEEYLTISSYVTKSTLKHLQAVNYILTKLIFIWTFNTMSTHSMKTHFLNFGNKTNLFHYCISKIRLKGKTFSNFDAHFIDFLNHLASSNSFVGPYLLGYVKKVRLCWAFKLFGPKSFQRRKYIWFQACHRLMCTFRIDIGFYSILWMFFIKKINVHCHEEYSTISSYVTKSILKTPAICELHSCKLNF